MAQQPKDKTVNFTMIELDDAEKAYKGIDTGTIFTESLMSEWLEKIVYQGFNPLHTIAAFMRKSAEKSVLGSRDADLGFLIMLFMERGSDIKKLSNVNTARMSKEGVDKVSAFASFYGLRKGSRGLPSHALTLSRIAAAYPFLSCYYANKHRANHPINTGMPRCMEVGCFASLIPKDPSLTLRREIIDILFGCHVDAMVELSKVINKDFGKKTLDEQRKEAALYAKAAQDSRILNSEERVERLIELKVLCVLAGKLTIMGKLARFVHRERRAKEEFYTLERGVIKTAKLKEQESSK